MKRRTLLAGLGAAALLTPILPFTAGMSRAGNTITFDFDTWFHKSWDEWVKRSLNKPWFLHPDVAGNAELHENIIVLRELAKFAEHNGIFKLYSFALKFPGNTLDNIYWTRANGDRYFARNTPNGPAVFAANAERPDSFDA